MRSFLLTHEPANPQMNTRKTLLHATQKECPPIWGQATTVRGNSPEGRAGIGTQLWRSEGGDWIRMSRSLDGKSKLSFGGRCGEVLDSLETGDPQTRLWLGHWETEGSKAIVQYNTISQWTTRIRSNINNARVLPHRTTLHHPPKRFCLRRANTCKAQKIQTVKTWG